MICVLCLRPIKEKVQIFMNCQHVCCSLCLDNYKSSPPILTETTTRIGVRNNTLYCPICMLPCSDTFQTSNLPQQLCALLTDVTKSRCRHCRGPNINATCVECLAACCNKCIACNHKGHTILNVDQAENDKKEKKEGNYVKDKQARNGTKDKEQSTMSTKNKQQKTTLDKSISSMWYLDELAHRLSARRTLAAQARRLQHEHETALARTKAAIQTHTRNQIAMLKQQEACLLASLSQHSEAANQHIEILHRLVQSNADTTATHIRYLYNLLLHQHEHRLQLLVNAPALHARTHSLLLEETTDDGKTQLTERVCLQYLLTHIPDFQPANLSPMHSSISFQQQQRLPAVSHQEYTLKEIIDEDKDNADQVYEATHADEQQPSINYHSWRLHEQPTKYANIYRPTDTNVEPGSAVFLPDDRLVITERKGHKISIWKPNYEMLDFDIISPDDIHPFGITYWQKYGLLVFTDLRHFTIGYVKSDGSSLTSLKYEIIRTPHSIGILPSNHFIVTDTHENHRGVKIIDPATSQVIRTFHTKSTPTWLTILHDGNVAVTDPGTSSVYFYDPHGNCTNKIHISNPEQVIEATHGNLLIASGTPSDSAVLLYDTRQQRPQRNALSTRHGLHAPSSIALGHHGQLAVVQRTGTVGIYKLYDCG